MVQVRSNCWLWAVMVLPCFLCLFSSIGHAQAEVSSEILSSSSQQKQMNARAVTSSPNQNLLPNDSVLKRLHKGQAKAIAPLPDMSSVKDVKTKKEVFFSFLLPLVENENKRLQAVRRRLFFIEDHVRWNHDLNSSDQAWLALVCKEFGIDLGNFKHRNFWQDLLLRVDEVPENLVLVQAANESAWGTSRFAREGNNLFGQWCFRPNCGLIPLNRPVGATYQVAEFSSIEESVRSYMHNLNTGYAYVLLREVRARMRDANEEPDASEMAAGLTSYSERGSAYVEEIRTMIRHNQSVIADVKTKSKI